MVADRNKQSGPAVGAASDPRRGTPAAPARVRANSGQSLLEFLLILPMLMGLSLLLIRVDTAIQMATVDQQYARMQTFHVNANSAFYPRLDLAAKMIQRGNNQMILGVSENAVTGDGFSPEPPTYKINGKKGGGSESKGEVSQRTNVRIRTTVTLCTGTVGAGNTTFLPYTTQGSFDGTSGVATGNWQLAENTTFDYCGHGAQTGYSP